MSKGPLTIGLLIMSGLATANVYFGIAEADPGNFAAATFSGLIAIGLPIIYR